MYVISNIGLLSVNLAQWFARLPLGQSVIKIGQSVLTVVMTLADHLVSSDQDFNKRSSSVCTKVSCMLINDPSCTVQYVSVTSHCSLSLVADRLSMGEE